MSEIEKTWDVVVVGGANMDYMVRGPRLPRPGETLRGDEFLQTPGGKGANQAVASARLGARAAFVGRVGADARGEAAIAQLQREGVDVRGVARDPDTFTGVALVMVDQHGEKQILAAGGANTHFTPPDVRAAADTLRRARVVLTQLSAARYRNADDTARAGGGARVVLDPSPAQPLSDELLRQVDLIKPDSREAEALTQIPVRDRASARSPSRRVTRATCPCGAAANSFCPDSRSRVSTRPAPAMLLPPRSRSRLPRGVHSKRPDRLRARPPP